MHKRVYITDFDIKPNTEELLTSKFQNVLNEVSKRKDILVLTKGSYVLSTIELPDDTNIEFEEGASILGSLNYCDYKHEEAIDYPLFQDSSHSFFEHSLFFAKNKKNIKFSGKGLIDMRSIWDTENVRQFCGRGPKCIALKDCESFELRDLQINNATDLAIYFAGTDNVIIDNVKMRVYIDGISPDGCKNVKISNCDLETGDDGVVLKTSFTLNKFVSNENIEVSNCKIKSRCNAFKIGTETNGDMKNIYVHDCYFYETRITGISVESVDGANLSNIKFENIKMKNVFSPVFVILGDRMRGPKGTPIGSIDGVYFNNIIAEGPYVPYSVIPWRYSSYVANDNYQYPWNMFPKDLCNVDPIMPNKPWQITSCCYGLKHKHIKNIVFKDCRFTMYGGAKDNFTDLMDTRFEYPEIYVYGRILPAKGLLFRYVDNIVIDNVKIETENPDVRKEIVII